MGIFNFNKKLRTGTNKAQPGYRAGTGEQVNQLIPGSGEQLVTDPLKGSAALKTIATAGTALGSLGLINKTNRIQQGRNMRMLTPIQTTVAPVQDLPAEVLAQKQGQISRLRSSYAGSDPSMKLVSDLTTSAQRGGMRDQLATERGTNLISERRRVASENAANQLRAGEIQHKNIVRNQELDDYKIGAKVNRMDHLNKLLSQTGAAVIDNTELTEAMGIKGDQVDKQNAINAIDSQMDYLTKKRSSMDLYDVGEMKSFDDQLKELLQRRTDIQLKPSQRFFRNPSVNAYESLVRKDGGKLIPKY